MENSILNLNKKGSCCLSQTQVLNRFKIIHSHRIIQDKIYNIDSYNMMHRRNDNKISPPLLKKECQRILNVCTELLTDMHDLYKASGKDYRCMGMTKYVHSIYDEINDEIDDDYQFYSNLHTIIFMAGKSLRELVNSNPSKANKWILKFGKSEVHYLYTLTVYGICFLRIDADDKADIFIKTNFLNMFDCEQKNEFIKQNYDKLSPNSRENIIKEIFNRQNKNKDPIVGLDFLKDMQKTDKKCELVGDAIIKYKKDNNIQEIASNHEMNLDTMSSGKEPLDHVNAAWFEHIYKKLQEDNDQDLCHELGSRLMDDSTKILDFVEFLIKKNCWDHNIIWEVLIGNLNNLKRLTDSNSETIITQNNIVISLYENANKIIKKTSDTEKTNFLQKIVESVARYWIAVLHTSIKNNDKCMQNSCKNNIKKLCQDDYSKIEDAIPIITYDLAMLTDLDEEWAKKVIYPLFGDDKKAPQAWQGFLQDKNEIKKERAQKIFELLKDFYKRTAANGYKNIPGECIEKFIELYIEAAFSWVEDPYKSWLPALIRKIRDRDRCIFANKVKLYFRKINSKKEVPINQKQQKWMVQYLQDRVDNGKSPLEKDEVKSLTSWLLYLDDSFPEAVTVITQIEHPAFYFDSEFSQLKKYAKEFPNDLAKLIIYFTKYNSNSKSFIERLVKEIYPDDLDNDLLEELQEKLLLPRLPH